MRTASLGFDAARGRSGASGCPLVWAGLLIVLLALLSPARAAPGDPVVIDSPAWRALMARPAADGDATAFYAADLLDGWGRPAEGAALRRALVARHLRELAGEPLAPATLSEVWRTAPPAPDALAALHARAAALQPRAAWVGLAPANDEAIRGIVERIGNRPPADLPSFVATWGDCAHEGTCRPRGEAALLSEEERQARIDARLREMERQRVESDRRWRERERRRERLQQAVVLGYLLGGLLLHLLLARHAGTVVATLATIALGPALTLLAFARWGVGDGWGGLAMLIFYACLAGSGLLLAPIYGWVHKVFFAGR